MCYFYRYLSCLDGRGGFSSGADIINDVTAMEGDAAMSDLVVGSKVPIILMHMRGTPKNMQQNCEYKNVVTEVAAICCNGLKSWKTVAWQKKK